MRRDPLTNAWPGLLCGMVFGLGLAVAQMTDPRKVLGFLDLAGAWDASLIFVMGGALAVTVPGFRLVLQRGAPRLAGCFHLPAGNTVDAPLLTGAALFGVGWGLAGYCPGPAPASIGLANAEALWFVPAMIAGAGLQRWMARRRQAPPSAVHPSLDLVSPRKEHP